MTDLRVVHEADNPASENPVRRVIATEVEVADTVISQARGLMFRSSLPEGYALVLEVGNGLLARGPSRQRIHMLFVRMPLDVVWLADDEVTKVARMQPWRSTNAATANRILELPAGAAAGVEPGDSVVLETPGGAESGSTSLDTAASLSDDG